MLAGFFATELRNFDKHGGVLKLLVIILIKIIMLIELFYEQLTDVAGFFLCSFDKVLPCLFGLVLNQQHCHSQIGEAIVGFLDQHRLVLDNGFVVLLECLQRISQTEFTSDILPSAIASQSFKELFFKPVFDDFLCRLTKHPRSPGHSIGVRAVRLNYL